MCWLRKHVFQTHVPLVWCFVLKDRSQLRIKCFVVATMTWFIIYHYENRLDQWWSMSSTRKIITINPAQSKIWTYPWTLSMLSRQWIGVSSQVAPGQCLPSMLHSSGSHFFGSRSTPLKKVCNKPLATNKLFNNVNPTRFSQPYQTHPNTCHCTLVT